MEESELSSTGSFFPPPKPILSSTLLSESPSGRSKPRRRIRRVDLDDDENGGMTGGTETVPFPGLDFMPHSQDGDNFSEDDNEAYATGVDVLSVHSANEKENSKTEDEDVDLKTLRQLKGISEGARKKAVKRPLPKLDTVTLLGERGLPALLKDLEKVTFQGRGHEFEDLNKLMFVYKSWANRMLPKFPFVEVMERLERLGTKREVHAALQGMRAGTWPPGISSEFVHESAGSSDDEISKPPEDSLRNEWQELLELPEDEAATQKSPSPPPVASTSTDMLVTETQDEQEQEDIATRIERNRRAALERLEAKRLSSSFHNTTPYRGGPSVLRKALRSVNSLNNTQ